MAYALLNGTQATIDLSFMADSAKCIAASWSARIGREFFDQTTFCSGVWVTRQPGRMQLTGTMSGFGSKGGPLSDPLSLMTGTAPIAMVLTADTGCTYTFSGQVGSNDLTMVAAANAIGGMAYESSGTVVTAWVVA